VARIVILGCAGSGKSRLARQIGACHGGSVISLDEIWRPDWGSDMTPAFREILARLHAGDAWVSDGNFAAVSFDIRLPRATLIVWLERSRWLCAWRATRRALRGDSVHTLRKLPDVLRFIRHFDRINRPRIEALRLQYAPDVPVTRLRSDKEAAQLLSNLSSP
jgi:adenylate kinase family enzyme